MKDEISSFHPSAFILHPSPSIRYHIPAMGELQRDESERSLRSRVSQAIRKMILAGEMRPGDRLRIETPGGGGLA